MIGMIGSLTLFLLARLFLTVESHTVLPPQNLSLLWIDDFDPKLTWAPPQHSTANCTFIVLSYSKGTSEDGLMKIVTSPSWTSFIVMDGGFLHLSVVTKCDNIESQPAVLNVSYPEMRDVQCYRYSSKDVTCLWKPAVPNQSVNFFYCESRSDVSPLPPLQECSSYSITQGVRTGCRLQSNLEHNIHIVFNGTENNTPFRNTFKKMHINDGMVERIVLKYRIYLLFQSKKFLFVLYWKCISSMLLFWNICHACFFTVKESLNWTVKKAGNKFVMSWNTPDIKSTFQAFQINYTECQKTKDLLIKDIEQTSYDLIRLPDCQYRMAMKAFYSKFNTAWSEEKYFDADTDTYGWVYAVVLTPLMLAGLTVLAFVCCRRMRIHIFPIVPQPRDHLTDIFNNNNKSTVGTMYIPEEEDDSCKITLLTDTVDINTNGAFPSSTSENKAGFCAENSP